MKKIVALFVSMIMIFAMVPMASATESSLAFIEKTDISLAEYQAIVDEMGAPNENNTINAEQHSFSASQSLQPTPRANGVTNIWNIALYVLGYNSNDGQYYWYYMQTFHASNNSFNDNITISGFDYNNYYYAYEIDVKHNFASTLYTSTWNGATIVPKRDSTFYGKWVSEMGLNAYTYISTTYFIADSGMGGTFKSNGPITQPYAKFVR